MLDPYPSPPTCGRTPRRRGRFATPLALTLAVLTLLLSACGGLTKDGAATVGDSVTASGSSARIFTATASNGGSIRLPGDRPTVLLFFGVDCGGCGPTATAMAQVAAERFGVADFAAVDIVPRESTNDIKGFLAANDATSLAYAVDADGTIFQAYGVTSLTTVVIVDANGHVAYRAVEPSADTIRSELAKVTG